MYFIRHDRRYSTEVLINWNIVVSCKKKQSVATAGFNCLVLSVAIEFFEKWEESTNLKTEKIKNSFNLYLFSNTIAFK